MSRKIRILIPLLSAILLFSILLFLNACRKEKVYSCDEHLNNWALQYIEYNQSLSREEIAKKGLDTQFAIINSLIAENNARIAREKIQYLIDHTTDELEKQHLEKLYAYIKAGLYKPFEEQEAAVDTFIDNWKEYARSTLKWTESTFMKNTGTWLTADEMELMKQFPSPSTPGGNGNSEQLSCNCSGGYFCESIAGKKCLYTAACKKADWGCGFLWMQQCTGRCSYF